MDNLVQVEKQQVVTDSKNVAKNFEKRHDHIIRDIENYKKDVPNFGEMFAQSFSTDSYGRKQKIYYLNRDGFSLLVMGFTGAKALEWKLKYIQAFNAMEQQLKAIAPKDNLKAKRLEVMQRNANAKVARLWLQISNNTQNQTYKEICNAYAANTLAEKEVLALPVVNEKTYTATEVAEMLGVTANRIGKIANANGLKTAQYGSYYHDKSRYSNKEVESFRYNAEGVNALKQIIQLANEQSA